MIALMEHKFFRPETFLLLLVISKVNSLSDVSQENLTCIMGILISISISNVYRLSISFALENFPFKSYIL